MRETARRELPSTSAETTRTRSSVESLFMAYTIPHMLERSSIDFSPPGFDFPLPATQRLAKRKAMTVCIAAIANNGVIVGAADTMLTSGDVEFEPFRQSRPRFG